MSKFTKILMFVATVLAVTTLACSSAYQAVGLSPDKTKLEQEVKVASQAATPTPAMTAIPNYAATLALYEQMLTAQAQNGAGEVQATPYVPLASPTPVADQGHGGNQGGGSSAQPTPMAVMPSGEDTGVPAFAISGAPSSVTIPAEALAQVVSPEQMASRGPSDNWNSIGYGTEAFLADAGVYLTFDQVDDQRNESAWLISPDTQYLLVVPGPTYHNLCEGCFLWFSGASMDVVADKYGITVDAGYGHSWFVILSGKEWDHLIDTDFNTSVEISNYNPGFVQVDRFPPGKFLSQLHVEQNEQSCHVQKVAGSDGATRCSVLILDVKTGGWIVITKTINDALWQFVATNIAN